MQTFFNKFGRDNILNLYCLEMSNKSSIPICSDFYFLNFGTDNGKRHYFSELIGAM